MYLAILVAPCKVYDYVARLSVARSFWQCTNSAIHLLLSVLDFGLMYTNSTEH